MIMDTYHQRLKTLTEDIINGIISVMNDYGRTEFTFPYDDLDESEKISHVVFDNNGEPYDAYVKKLSIIEGKCIEFDFKSESFSATINTSWHYEAKNVNFLENVYSELVYWLEREKKS